LVSAISTGVYGYPPRLAARVALDTLTVCGTQVELVRLVAFDETTFDLYRSLLSP